MQREWILLMLLGKCFCCSRKKRKIESFDLEFIEQINQKRVEQTTNLQFTS
jgi:hypothetical protein